MFYGIGNDRILHGKGFGLKKLFISLVSLFARLLPLPVKQAIYRLPPLARLIRGSLNAAVESGLGEVEIAAGDLKGYKILLNLKTEKSRWLGTYEPELAEAALRPALDVASAFQAIRSFGSLGSPIQ